MATDGSASAASEIEAGSIYPTTQERRAELRAATAKRFLQDGRGFKAGNGGGRQKKYCCSDAAIYSGNTAKAR